METTAPIKNDPKFKAAADFIAAKFRALQAVAHAQGKPSIKGKHVAIAWTVQDDGTMRVVLESGPKIIEEIPSLATIKQGVSALIKSIEDPTGENDTMLQKREAELNQRQAELDTKFAEVEAMQRTLQAQLEAFRAQHPEGTEVTPPNQETTPPKGTKKA